MSADQKQALRLAFHLTSRLANPSAMQCARWGKARAGFRNMNCFMLRRLNRTDSGCLLGRAGVD